MAIIDTSKAAMLRNLRQSLTLSVAEATHNLVVVISAANRAVWELPTDDLLDFLNEDLSVSEDMLKNSYLLAMAGNASLQELVDLVKLDGSPMFPTRAPTERGRADIVFDPQAGQWICQQPAFPTE